MDFGTNATQAKRLMQIVDAGGESPNPRLLRVHHSFAETCCLHVLLTLAASETNPLCSSGCERSARDPAADRSGQATTE